MSNSAKTYLSDICVFDRSVYESNVPTDSTSGSVLRIIRGPLAEWDSLNRNGRKYSERLWDNVLSSPYVTDQLMYNTLYGEANHPADRMEVDFERVSHRIAKMWKVPQSNQIFGEIHILNTPFGRIINTLYGAGGVIGYSSRAGGALHQRKDYIEVDENQYNFITFDAVPFPSVQSARPNEVVTEGVVKKQALETNVHNALFKIIKECDEKDFKNIKSFINSIEGYDLTPEKLLLESVEDIIVAKSDDTVVDSGDTIEVVDDSESQIDTLQSTLQSIKAQKQSLEKENEGLRQSLNSALNKISNVLQDSKDKELEIQNEVFDLKDTIARKDVEIAELQNEIDDLQLSLDELRSIEEACKALKYQNNSLIQEGVSVSNKKLEDELSNNILVNESLEKEVKNLSKEKEELKGELSEAYGEIASTVDDINRKDSLIVAQQDTITALKSDLQSLRKELSDVDDGYQSAIDRRDNQIEDYEQKVKDLESKIKKLNGELDDLDESYTSLKESNKVIKHDLISVIAGNYGLTVESVQSKLSVGFSKSDVYSICESMSTNNSIGSFRNSIVDTQIVNESSLDRKENIVNTKPRVGEIFSNRRG